MDNYHISPGKDGWELKREGATRASRTAATKEEIVRLAADFLDGRVASVKIHKADGTLQEERTYPRNADPSKSKG